jgi:hypothetical protein
LLAPWSNNRSIGNTIKNALDMFSCTRNDIRYSALIGFAVKIEPNTPTLQACNADYFGSTAEPLGRIQTIRVHVRPVLKEHDVALCHDLGCFFT